MIGPIRVFDRDAARSGKPPRLAFGVPAGTEVATEAGTVLYARRHLWYERLNAEPVRLDVYRTRRREAPPESVVSCALPAEPRPVSSEEVATWRQSIAELPAADRKHLPRDEELNIRLARGDLDQIPYVNACSWRMSLDEAVSAGVMRMRSRELAWGIRPSVTPGRWEATIGLHGQLEVVATTDSPETAEALASAAHGHAWWERYQVILHARRGDLSWGEPIVAATESVAFQQVLAGA